MTDEPEKVDLESPDLAAEARARLADLFPGVLADGVLDATRLGELLDVEVTAPADGRERYGLMWAGKAEAVRSLQTPSRGTLVPDAERSVNWDTAENVFIEGDNLEVLKLLQKAYNDRIKAVFIDPPYNTGTDLVYPDDFTDPIGTYLSRTGQLDSGGNSVSTERDVTGRRHSAWLSMMFPRLVLARNLLTRDGLLFVTIDDGEYATLKMLLDEIFGESNYVGTFVWQSRTSISDDLEISPNHNYVLTYSRDRERLAFWGEPLREEEYSNRDGDPRGPWKLVPLDANKPGGDTLYPVLNPTTGEEHWPPQGRSWAINRRSMQDLLDDGRVAFGLKGDSAPKRKLYLDERTARGDTRTPSSLLLDAGTTKDGTAEVAAILGKKKIFDYPKPVALLERLLRYATAGDKSAIVLDFFAGSGTTAEALLRLNERDAGSRRFVLVQYPERTPERSEARKAGFETIADIARVRVNAALTATSLPSDVRDLRLAASGFQRADQRAEDELALPVSTLAGELDANAVAVEMLLREGVPLSAPWTRHLIGDEEAIVAHDVAVVLSLELTEDVVTGALKLGTSLVVFLEDGFAGRDALKTNAHATALRSGVRLKTV